MLFVPRANHTTLFISMNGSRGCERTERGGGGRSSNLIVY